MGRRKQKATLADDLADLIVTFFKWLFGKISGKQQTEPIESKENSDDKIFEHEFTPRSFFSKREIALFHMLKDIASAKDLFVFAKVRLFDLIETAKNVSRDDRFWQNNKINQMHLDFVLVDSASLKPVCAIELDDSSHQSEKVQYRDSKKDEALASAKISLFRVPQGYFTIDQIKDMLQGI